MADYRIEDHLPLDAGGFKFILVPVHPATGEPVPRCQVGEIATENAENVFVPYVMEKPALSGGQGRKGVAVPHTPETLVGGATPARKVIIQPLASNGGLVAVGLTNATRSTVGAEAGIVLAATGQPITLEIRDLLSVWIDANVAGEGVSYLYLV